MSGKVRKIQDFDRVYYLLRILMEAALKRAYCRIEYAGRDRIPRDGAVIYAPNHTNALMDALVVLTIDGREKVFVARADIFKNRRVASILSFLKIMPIMRSRDGMEEVRKNSDTINRAVDVLKDKVPFVILPEGTHRAMHSLLPLSKGIFRIAISAEGLVGDSMPLYIVPVGIEYGNFFRLRSTVLVNIGEPVNVGGYMKSHCGLTLPETVNSLKDCLAGKMKETILYIPDDRWYDASYEVCALVVREQLRECGGSTAGKKKNPLYTRLQANKRTMEQIRIARDQASDKVAALFEKAEKIRRRRLARGISLSSVTASSRMPRLYGQMAFLVLLPYVVCCAVLSSPLEALVRLISRKMKDRAFFNSVRFAARFVLWPLIVAAYAAAAFSLLEWEWALLSVAALCPAPSVSDRAFRLVRLSVSDIRLYSDKKLRTEMDSLRNYFFRDIASVPDGR